MEVCCSVSIYVNVHHLLFVFPPVAPARAGRKTWLARRGHGRVAGPAWGRRREVATYGRTVGAARCTEEDGSTRPRASHTPGAYT
eukprot:1345862-Pleurochrysis_carterae.AAC.1